MTTGPAADLLPGAGPRIRKAQMRNAFTFSHETVTQAAWTCMAGLASRLAPCAAATWAGEWVSVPIVSSSQAPRAHKTACRMLNAPAVERGSSLSSLRNAGLDLGMEGMDSRPQNRCCHWTMISL